VIFTELSLAGAWLIEPEKSSDQRGFFARMFEVDEFADRGLKTAFVQSSVSFNTRRGTLRGLHYQTDPHGETKLARVTSGAIWDVIVDIRPNSPTAYRWAAVELSAHNHRTLYIPKGFAHGFVSLADNTEIFYQMADPYVPSAAAGMRWDDPRLAIDWPLEDADLILSERDRLWPLLPLGPDAF
jgi:dTDP-4-dehydrorhamnose 3,5-epimerase